MNLHDIDVYGICGTCQRPAGFCIRCTVCMNAITNSCFFQSEIRQCSALVSDWRENHFVPLPKGGKMTEEADRTSDTESGWLPVS